MQIASRWYRGELEGKVVIDTVLRDPVTWHAPVKLQFRPIEIRKLALSRLGQRQARSNGDIVPRWEHRFVAINRARASFYRTVPIVCLVSPEQRDAKRHTVIWAAKGAKGEFSSWTVLASPPLVGTSPPPLEILNRSRFQLLYAVGGQRRPGWNEVPFGKSRAPSGRDARVAFLARMKVRDKRVCCLEKESRPRF